ncbi:MAG TPA: capsule assembly Wzi family protein [Armatimonadota bacterium]|nr:capsule assembly Wzi family protein [Armatimonadota bacterium]
MGKHAANRMLALLTILAISLAFAATAQAGSRTIASTDRVPFGDWTYDVMVSLASDGLVPGMSARVFEGDRFFNRIEMAQAVASIIESSGAKELGLKQTALIEHLVLEFKPELMEVAPQSLQKWSERTTGISLPMGGEAFLLGYRKIAATEDTGDNADHTSFTVPYRYSGFLNLSSQVFGMATLADKEEKFFHERRQEPEKVFIRGFDKNFVWSVGYEFLNWGPAYSGSLILSDNSAAFLQFRGTKDINFGKLFGKAKITQFVSTFEDNDKTLYLFGRRYEKRLSDRWHAGVSETAKLSTRPNPLILVLPFYLYQHLFNEVDTEFNTLYAADLSYRTSSGFQIYGELVIDDITAPRIFGDWFERPCKTGYTIGFYAPKAFGGTRLSTFRAEYTFLDRLTYEATRPYVPELAYTHDGDIIGHPIGPNAKALYLRGEQFLSKRVSVIAEYLNQHQTDPGPPERDRRRILSLTLAYDGAPDKSTALRVTPYEITPPGQPALDGVKYELIFSCGF